MIDLTERYKHYRRSLWPRRCSAVSAKLFRVTRRQSGFEICLLKKRRMPGFYRCSQLLPYAHIGAFWRSTSKRKKLSLLEADRCKVFTSNGVFLMPSPKTCSESQLLSTHRCPFTAMFGRFPDVSRTATPVKTCSRIRRASHSKETCLNETNFQRAQRIRFTIVSADVPPMLGSNTCRFRSGSLYYRLPPGVHHFRR